MSDTNEFPLWSTELYPDFDTRTQRWYVAWDDDGTRCADSDPESDFYCPVPESFATEAGAAAAIAVLKVWEAPIANEEEVLGFAKLRATPEWAALAPHLPHSFIGKYTEAMFAEAAEYGMDGGQRGAFKHYEIMVAAGVQVQE